MPVKMQGESLLSGLQRFDNRLLALPWKTRAAIVVGTLLDMVYAGTETTVLDSREQFFWAEKLGLYLSNQVETACLITQAILMLILYMEVAPSLFNMADETVPSAETDATEHTSTIEELPDGQEFPTFERFIGQDTNIL